MGNCGYLLDAHGLVTPDGYILTMYRLSRQNSHNDPLATPHFTPLVMGHGLFADSDQWFLRKDQNLGG